MSFQNNWFSVTDCNRESKTYEARHYNSLQSLTLVNGLRVNGSSTPAGTGGPSRPASGDPIYQLALPTHLDDK